MGEISTGEIQRNLDRIERRLDQLPYVPRETFDESRKNQGERVGDLEERIVGVEMTLRRINATAWTAVVLPTLMLIIGVLINYAVR